MLLVLDQMLLAEINPFSDKTCRFNRFMWDKISLGSACPVDFGITKLPWLFTKRFIMHSNLTPWKGRSWIGFYLFIPTSLFLWFELKITWFCWSTVQFMSLYLHGKEFLLIHMVGDDNFIWFWQWIIAPPPTTKGGSKRKDIIPFLDFLPPGVLFL